MWETRIREIYHVVTGLNFLCSQKLTTINTEIDGLENCYEIKVDSADKSKQFIAGWESG
jgi:hypothetical protein